MPAPATCWLKSMTCTRCSQAIAWRSAGVYGSILPTEVARSTIVPALPDFMAAHPELVLEVSSSDRHVDLVQEGFDCVLRLGPIGDETLIARPLGKLRMVNAASPAYLTRYGVPLSLEDLQRQDHRTIQLFDDAGRKTSWMGISGRRQLRDAAVARCATRQQRANLRSRRRRRPWPDLGRHSWGLAHT